MSAIRLPLALISIILMCICAVEPADLWCPPVCDCYFDNDKVVVWNCSGVFSVSQLIGVPQQSELKNFPDHLIFQDSKIDFKTNLTEYFSTVSSVEIANSLVDCTKHLTWLLNWSSKLQDPDNLLCTSPQTLNGTNVLKALNLIDDVNAQCPKYCECTLLHAPKDDQYVTVSVRCNNIGLTELPETLPANGYIHLDLSNNRLEDISGLATNPSYKRVTVVYLNNNHIRSIAGLEDSEWIEQVGLLSLQRNNLRELPIQTLNTVLRYQDVNGFRFFLSNNPWRCDCLAVTQFQSLVLQHKQLIKDENNVTCGPNEGALAGLKINSIELASVCDIPGYDSINLMDVLSTMLGLLTLLIVGKLLYDYYAYRKTGQLPWLASKLP